MRSDGELVGAVLEGDRAAFEQLVVRYERIVRAVCLNILNDRHLAADAAQEVFVSAYQKLGTLRDCKTFAPWLMQIAKRCSLDMVRIRRDEAAFIHNATTANLPSTFGGCHPGRATQPSEDNHQLDEEKQILLSAVMRLGDGDRETIMLRYFDGRSVQEVADIMGKSVGTITKQLSRAHAKLRKVLSSKC